ncbi:peptide ABC transporter substrate-binding protein [Nodosilinea sp. P-1105]|uniref:peptide ABC transporter substrate-binding protein n=1 Tax=Nodosilinea sp. P-1105 TaxID=2546229 RepID=UPI00146F5369|nr:peptide ABC transporter substrate-binding protein [Nodosilinea sp. P-1105]NMF81833.1 peptide ABC transporter substrate-binding protein [Nodosilinea sp. P-1105]
MISNFQATDAKSKSLNPLEQPAPVPQPHQETVRITVTGSPEGVKAVIYDLHSRRFAEANDWCPLVPTGKVGEVMTVLIKRVWVD